MSNAADGMNYAPKGKPAPVCGPGEFRFAAVALDHGHIYGMTNGLKEAGAELVKVYDADPDKVAAFRKVHPEAEVAASEAEILEDPTIQLVAAAAVPSVTVTEPLKNNTGTLLASQSGIEASVLRASDLVSVHAATGLTTNASGVLATISNAAITTGQQYHIVIKLADGGVGITGAVTAS